MGPDGIVAPPDDLARSRVCRLVRRRHALRHLAVDDRPARSRRQVELLHWYVACRLVLEGGFRPDEVTPRPPFDVVRRPGGNLLRFDPSKATGREATVFGGLKTKRVGVLVSKPQLGPVLAVSCQGTPSPFRSLTNRTEKTVGECANVHMAYPALVFGCLFMVRANEAGMVMAPNDMAVNEEGHPVEAILRFHAALREMSGRHGIRDDISRYEAVSMGLVKVRSGVAGRLLTGFPPADSPLHLERFFSTLYQRYEERFVYGAPNLKSVTGRLEWSLDSPALTTAEPRLDYNVRLASP